MTRVDIQAREAQFIDHLAPIWLAMPPALRGDFIAHRSLVGRAAAYGIPAVSAPIDLNRPVLVASFGDQKKVRQAGRSRVARIEHGAGQSYGGDPRFGSHGSYAGGRGCEDIELFLCPNEQSADRWQRAYPAAAVEIVGCPKLDFLPKREPGPVTVAVSFHFDIPVIPETRWAFPTYRPVLPALVERFNVIGHTHPKAAHALALPWKRLGVEMVADFADICRRADVYVCDNSSTLFEFAATGRPVVVLNDPGYRRDVQHGLRFWDAAPVGLNVDRPERLVEVVERALTDPAETRQMREDVLARVYPIRVGAATLAAEALAEWVGATRVAA